MTHGRLARLIAASAVVVTTLAGPLAGMAQADGGTATDPAAWAEFLSEHPELTAGSGLSSAAAACEAVATCPAGLAVGAFALSFAGTTKVLHWAFGSGGDQRSGVTTAAGGGWSWGAGSQINGTVPSAGINPTAIDVGWPSSLNPVGSTPWSVYAGYKVDCVNASTGAPHTLTGALQTGAGTVQAWSSSTYTAFSDGTKGHISFSGTICPSTDKLGEFRVYNIRITNAAPDGSVHDLTETSPLPTPAVDWKWDSGAHQWTIVPHVECAGAGGSHVVVDGDPVVLSSITANEAVDMTLPACPDGDTAVIGYATGGRTGSDPTGQVVAAVPTTTTQTGTSSTTDDGTSTSTSTTTGPNPSTADAGSDSCMGAFWSWNPVQWVFVPIKCALLWAFVPGETDLETQLEPLHEAYETTIGALFTAFGDVIGAFVPSTGTSDSSGICLGPGLSIDAIGLHDVHPLDACDEPMRTVASYVRTILTVSVWIGLALVMVKMGGSAFGLRVPMGGGDDTP